MGCKWTAQGLGDGLQDKTVCYLNKSWHEPARFKSARSEGYDTLFGCGGTENSGEWGGEEAAEGGVEREDSEGEKRLFWLFEGGVFPRGEVSGCWA
jgi:hypothetical protein